MLVWSRGGGHPGIVTHAGLRSLLDHPDWDLKLVPLEAGYVNSLPDLPQIWSAIDEAVPIALSSMAQRRRGNAEECADKLEASLRAEFGYLSWRADTADTATEAETARAAIAARKVLVASLRRPRADLFGLALVALA